MTNKRDASGLFSDAVRREMFRGWREMFTGRRAAGNVVTLEGAPTGKTWVRPSKGSWEAIAVLGVASQVDAKVWVGPDINGHDRIYYVSEDTFFDFGDKGHLVLSPPISGKINILEVMGQNFVPGRLVPDPDSGPMHVKVEPFAHPSGLFDGPAIDLTAYLPVTAGMNAWIAVAADPATNTLHAFSGAETWAALNDMLETDAFAVAIPTGYYPSGAVALNSETTEIGVGARIVDLRRHFGQIGFPALDELSNVNSVGKADGNVLVWNEGVSEWAASPMNIALSFGSGIVKTLSAGVAAAGSDRHLVLAAESGTVDDCIEITGLNIGEEVIVRADSGDTITLKHNDTGATDKILLCGGVDFDLFDDKTMKLVKIASGKVVQYVDENSGGGGGAPTNAEYVTISADGSLSAEVIIPGLAGSGDRQGLGGGGLTKEFDNSGDTLPTWTTAIASEDIDTTIPSYYYAHITSATETFGYWNWVPGSVAFDARCKLSRQRGAVGFVVANAANTIRVMLLAAWANQTAIGFGTTYGLFVQPYTFAGGSWSLRGTGRISTAVVYMRITRDSSNNYTWHASDDGLLWTHLGTFNISFTVEKIGFRSDSVQDFAVDWLRTNV